MLPLLAFEPHADLLALRDPNSVLLLTVNRVRRPPGHSLSPLTCRRPTPHNHPRSYPQMGDRTTTRKVQALLALPAKGQRGELGLKNWTMS